MYGELDMDKKKLSSGNNSPTLFLVATIHLLLFEISIIGL